MKNKITTPKVTMGKATIFTKIVISGSKIEAIII
jgi:hypothetical protein